MTGIDPRLRARRIDVARDHGRRRLRRFAMVAGATLLAVAALGATRSPLLDVDRIDVRGADGPQAAEVREVSGIVPGEPLLWLDAGAVERRVASLAWVADAQVERSWPSTLVVAVEARTPVAVAGVGPRWVLVDEDGLALAAGRSAALPTISVPAPEVGGSLAPAGRDSARVVASLPEELRDQVVTVAVASDGSTLTLDDEIEIRWGGPEQSGAKAAAALVILEEADRGTIATIDVTVPRATTVTRQTGAR
jgi:cell division protein FtsQ